jgi:hypothetical protein
MIKEKADKASCYSTQERGQSDMPVWKFSVNEGETTYGNKKRKSLSKKGCNEPFRNRYWCPKLQWFRKTPCPFINRHECETFEVMCGSL